MGDVDIEGLSKSFKRKGGVVNAVDSLDLHLNEGEMLVLLGPSGCGKSTTLRCIAGLEKPTAGTISISGSKVFDASKRVDVPPNRRDIGMVFQSYALWPHLTVRKNVEYPLRARHMRDTLRSSRVSDVLDMVRCGPLANRYPGQISGGQQQRVALARALVSEPALLLLDEPLSNLDTLLRTELRAQLQTVHRRVGFTGVHVTHDQAEAFTLGDRVAVMRDGKIEQLATPTECFSSPVTSYVADFTGASNQFDLQYNDGAWRTKLGEIGWAVSLPSDSSTQTLDIRLRPDDMVLVPARESNVGTDSGQDSDLLFLGVATVEDVLFAGTTTEYRVLLGEDEVAVIERNVARPRFKVGASVEVRFRAGLAHPYDTHGRSVDAVFGDGRYSDAGVLPQVESTYECALKQAER